MEGMAITKLILNECEYAEELLRSGLCGEKPYQAISILSKYFYHKRKMKKKDISLSLHDFLFKFYPPYRMEKFQWGETIEKLLSNVQKTNLYEIAGVRITKSEMDRIQDIDNEKLERVAFVMLCLAKLNDLKSTKNNGWVNTDVKEIFSFARIPARVNERFMMLGKLEERGLIEFPKKNGNLNNRVTFIHENSDEALFISDFRELGYEYQRYCGENICMCAECGVLFRGNRQHNQRYCTNCSPRTKQMDKPIICEDCGKQFFVSSLNSKSTRCPSCYLEYRRIRKLESQRNRRDEQNEVRPLDF